MESINRKLDASFQDIHERPKESHFNQRQSTSSTSSRAFTNKIPKRENLEFTKYQRTVLNNMAYFAGATTRIFESSTVSNGTGSYFLANITVFGTVVYWSYHISALIKAIYLAFLVNDYFGPVLFFDKIAALDYMLCFGLMVLSCVIWFRRYPFYEIIQAGFRVVNSIYAKLGYPEDILRRMNWSQKQIVVTHSLITWIGCAILMTTYLADPKNCAFTYSSFELDNTFLRVIFAIHEFWFMELAWVAYSISLSFGIFQGITLSNLFGKMSDALCSLYADEGHLETVTLAGMDSNKLIVKNRILNTKKVAYGTEYDINKLLMDYKKLMIICHQYNDWTAYTMLFMQICGGCQFVSDVFAGVHILKKPGTGFIDVYFYIQDSITAGFMLTRTYFYMALASKASTRFLKTLERYLTYQNPKRLELRKIAKSLKVISLNVGPCRVFPFSTLTIMNTLSNYWVCAALW